MEHINQQELSVTGSSQKNNTWERLTWGAIIAGVVVSFAYEILLNFLGVGLGLASFNLRKTEIFTLGIGAITWLAVSGVLSMGIGAWFTGKLSNVTCKYKLFCYGVITWSVATLFTVLIATTTSSAIIGGTINIINIIEQPISQTSIGVDNNLWLQEDLLTKEQQDVVNKQFDLYTQNIGKTSIILFIAFFLSGVASVVGAICGGKHNNSPKTST